MDRNKTVQQGIEELQKILQVKKNEWKSLQGSLKESGRRNKKNKQQNDTAHTSGLHKDDITRYSRQILLSDIGVKGQERLCASKVLVVGAGGLGCPSAAYLAGAGIGEIGIIDYDTVEITNIHRQILHTEKDQGVSKVKSAADSLRSINSSITITPYQVQLSSRNAKEIISKYDVVLDCTDNIPTRYLLNDACVMSKKLPPVYQFTVAISSVVLISQLGNGIAIQRECDPNLVPLISGSALKMEGQLTIYGYRCDPCTNDNPLCLSPRGPCLRCVFPQPPTAGLAGSCSTDGVAGPVTGVIGSLQAMEAIKYLVDFPPDKLLVERMLIFDGAEMTFRTVKLRPRKLKCDVCSDTPKITELIDYEEFCNAKAKEKDQDLNILADKNRIKPKELASKMNKPDHLLLDIRNEAEFCMCNIEGAVNLPVDILNKEQIKKFVNTVKGLLDNTQGSEVTLLCRRGNDTQVVADQLLQVVEEQQKHRIKDLIGGLHRWAKDVDKNFPVY